MFRPFLIFPHFVFHSYSFPGKKMNKPTALLVFLAICIWAISCGPQKTTEETLSTLAEEDQIEQREMVKKAVEALSSWTGFWRQLDSSFSPEDFFFDRTEVFEELEWPEENPFGEESPFYPYLLAHPEGEGVVDIYSYKVFVPAEGKPGFQPDSEVIYFKNNGLRERLLFIGPSGGFDEALWLSPEHLLVAGYFEEERGFSPKIWLINTEEKQYAIFSHPFSTTNFQRNGYLIQKLQNIVF